MKEFKDLTEIELRVLVQFCKANGYSTKSHVPIEAVNLDITGVHPKHIRRAKKQLISSGFVLKHPTGRQMTYSISIDGLKGGNILKNEE